MRTLWVFKIFLFGWERVPQGSGFERTSRSAFICQNRHTNKIQMIRYHLQFYPACAVSYLANDA